VNKLWLVLLAMAIALSGCFLSREARADPIEAGLGQAFALPGGQEASISGENLRLRFDQVLEDSRCPTQVDCVWTGQARIAVVVQQAQGAPTTVEFNTNPAPGANNRTVDAGDYSIELQRLDPYPETPEDALALADYRATLVVRRN
jgi:hypothetical protein